jgi:TRAP-type C4-dicarboxylate transport system permease small subunit
LAHDKIAGRVGFLIRNLEEIVCGFLLASIIVVMFLDVVLRYLFKSPFLWTDEYTRLALIWMTFTGVIVAVKKGTHINVDVLFVKLPRAWQRILLLLGKITFMGFCTLMIINGIPLTKLKMDIPTPALGWSWGLFYLPLVVSGVLVIFWILVDLFRKKPGAGS